MQQSSMINPTKICLRRGQSHYADLRRGTVIRVASGALKMISRWPLEHSLLTVEIPIQRGGVYRVPTSGQFEIAAINDVVLEMVSPRAGFSIGSWSLPVFRRLTLRAL